MPVRVKWLAGSQKMHLNIECSRLLKFHQSKRDVIDIKWKNYDNQNLGMMVVKYLSYRLLNWAVE